MPAAEQAALRAQPHSGNTVARVLEDYESRLEQLADHCAEQFKWADDQSHIRREWIHAAEWEAFCDEALRDFCRHVSNRLNPVVCSLGTSTNVLAYAQEQLEKIHEAVRRKLVVVLDARIAESKSKSRGDGLSIASRLFWLFLGAAIGVAATLAKQRL